MIQNNRWFHALLTNGVKVEYRDTKTGEMRGGRARLVDFDNPGANDLLVVRQLTIAGPSGKIIRPDLTVFLNGLPIAVIELKDPTDPQADLGVAIDQLDRYMQTAPDLFVPNLALVVSDGMLTRVGSITSDRSRFMPWRPIDDREGGGAPTLEALIRGLFEPRTLVDYLQTCVIFEEDERGEIAKKIAGYHQFRAMRKARASVLAHLKPPSGDGDGRGGVIWHTQGSGKSLTMLMLAGALIREPRMTNPTIVMITDRNDLDDQLFDTFANCRQLLRQEPVQAENRDNLREKLKVASGGIVFTTIQKFSPDDAEVIYPLLSDRKNIIVIADEAHRSQYGFKAKTIDVKDENGNIIGQRTAYGFAKYVRDALPNATFIGFTGTPIELTDRNTPAVFGNYIDIYDIAQSVEDKATVKIYYESRLAKVELNEEGKQLINELDEELEKEDLSATEQAKAKWTKLEAIVGTDTRLENVARDAIKHFEQRQEVFDGKAMFVTMSRRIAVTMYEKIIKLHPYWHDEDLTKGAVKVVITAASSEGPELAKHHMTKDQRRQIANRFKDSRDPLQFVIVCDMWLTGFDVPCLHTMYFDKPMKGHSLMQAIARVNRVYLDKPGGLIVDYIGMASDLKKAMAIYANSGGKGEPANLQEQAVELMLEKFEVVAQFFKGFDYQRYFSADTSEKLSIILQSEEHVLSLEDGKARYIGEVTVLSKAFSLSIPHEKAIHLKETVAFFQAVKARLVKFERTGSGKTVDEIETAIRQVVDQAITSDKIIDIFDAAGIKKPDISILSEEFLAEIKGMKRKNLAFELLKKLLNDEIQVRIRKNIIQSKKLMELLEEAIRKYQNNLITAAEVIDELIKLAKDIKKADARGEETGMSDEELAFYDALANNESARKVLGDETLQELAIVLVDRVKKNASIDWAIKENVRASSGNYKEITS